MGKLEQLSKQQQEIAAAIKEERAKSREEAVANVSKYKSEWKRIA